MRIESADKFLLYGIWAALILLLLMPFLITTNTIFPFIVGKAIYSRIIIDILVGFWVILVYLDRSYKLPRSWLVAFFGVYVLVSLLAGVFGVSIQRSLWSTFERMQGIVDLTHWFALTLVLVSVIRTTKNWFTLLNINLGISLLMALVGIAESFDFALMPFYPFLGSAQRIGITLGNPSFVGSYLMVNVLLASGFLAQSFQQSKGTTSVTPSRMRRERRRVRQEGSRNSSALMWRIFWIVVIVLELWVITLTGTRGAVVGLAAGLAAFAFGSVASGLRMRIKLAASAVVVGVVVLVVSAIVLRDAPIVKKLASVNILVERLIDIAPEQDPFQSRLFAFSVAYQSLIDRPVLGWGPENYLVAYGRFYSSDATSPEVLDQAHNKPVEELVTKGILGLFSYIAIWGIILFTIVRRLRREGAFEQTFTLTVAAALVAYFVQNLFLFDTPATMLLFVLLLSVVVNFETANSQSTEESAPEQTGSRPWKAIYVVKEALLRKVAPIEKLMFGERLEMFTRIRRVNVVVFSLILVMISMWMHFRALNAASTILTVTEQVSSVDSILSEVDRSIETFPALANYPRLVLINNVGSVWGELSEEESGRAMAMVEREAARAIESEPENWRIHIAMVHMYRDVIIKGGADFDYLDAAKPYLDKSALLAPERIEIREALQKFESMELQRIDAREFRQSLIDNK